MQKGCAKQDEINKALLFGGAVGGKNDHNESSSHHFSIMLRENMEDTFFKQ